MSEGPCVLLLTIPGSHLRSCGLSTRIKSSGCMAGRGLEDLSCYDLCWSCPAWSTVFTSPSVDNDRPVLDLEGRLTCILLSSGALPVMRCCGRVGYCRGITWRDEDLHPILCISGGGSSQPVQLSPRNHWLADSMDQWMNHKCCRTL